MSVVDKERFLKQFPVLAIRVAASLVDSLRKKLGKDIVISLPRVKSVIPDDQDTTKRLLLLSEHLTNEKEIPQEIRGVLDDCEAQVVSKTISLTYDHFTADEVLASLLPTGMDIPSSFETVGHLAHVNLRDEHEPYKHLIGRVLLDKNPSIRTVVNKVGTIDSTFRFFHMEVIAGEKDTLVQVREEGCLFEFDYSKVYWNSRLQFEHRRLVQSFNKGSLVCDMFCGVGPFALPAAKRACTVYANDLNPDSIYWLRHNMLRNKVATRIKAYNMDAREFVGKALADLKVHHMASAFDHYIMNLPASAHEFLDIFPKLVSDGMINAEGARDATLIHCYTFCKSGEDPIQKVEMVLNTILGDSLHLIKRIRDVAPNKEMFCVSFRLPQAMFSVKRARLE